jgi:hypothetical protein
MTKKDYFNIELPKWPECRVIGKPVTHEQAQEIIIRTNRFYFNSNDRDFSKEIISTLGIQVKDGYPYYDYDEMDKVKDEYNILSLEYLNNERVVSCWIGGPNGWIDWSGTIQQYGKNIGKWPCVESVYEDWTLIAKAFPYLDLRCQLFSGEGCEEDTKPLIEFVVKNGKVRMCKPKNIIFEGISPNLDYSRLLSDLGERGCTLEMFQIALETTKNSLKN